MKVYDKIYHGIFHLIKHGLSLMKKAKSRDEIAEQSKSFFRNLFVVCGVIQKLRNFHEYVRTNLASDVLTQKQYEKIMNYRFK